VSTPLSNSPGLLRPLLRLVWPVLVEQVLVMLVGFSDTLLAGQYLTESHLAAMTMISYVLWMLTNLFSLVSIGATAMTARFIGAQDSAAASRVVNQSFLLGGLFALVFTTVGVLGCDRLVGLLQLEGEPAQLAEQYLRFIMPMLPLIMLEAVGIGCLRGAGDMVTGLVAMIVVNVLNIAVGWSLLLGWGPFPQLGWQALAIGAACGHAAGGLIPFVVLLRGRFGLRIRLSQLRPDGSLMRRILRIGVPGGLDVLSIVICQLIFLSIVNQLSVDEVAAHGVAIRIESLAYLPGYAFQLAAATLAGQYLGARNYRKAGRIVLVACLTNGSLLTAAGLALFIGAQQLVAVFVSSQQAQVLEIAPHLLRIVAFAMPPLALLQVLTGALRGAGDTRWPLAVTWLGFVGLRIPLAWLLVLHWGWGIQGAWYAMVIDVALRTALIAYRFLHGGWKRVEV
jgi:putative MATE family efflux protein